MQPSKRFVAALRLSKRNQYEIAWEAGLNPNLLSRLVNGIDRLRENDDRIIAVGRVLGLSPEECFEESEPEGGKMAFKGCLA